MSMTKLKKLLKEGAALLSQEHGADTLYDVLKGLVGVRLNGFQATVATATIAGMVVEKDMKLKSFAAKVMVAGSAGATTVKMQKNGVDITGATITIDNTAADPTLTTVALDVALVAGDQIAIVVSAAPTGGTNLAASALLHELDIEA